MIAEITTLTKYKNCEKTLQNAIPCVGVGLHSGRRVHMTLRPAPVGYGIVFKRTDISDKDNIIPVSQETVVDTRMCSCVGNKDGVSVGTIEHLMAALSGFGITNILIEVDSAEVPVMDGSAIDYVTLIECAGIVKQDAPLKAVKILKEVSFDDGKGSNVCLYPAEKGLSIDFMIDFAKSKIIGRQEYSISLTERNFKDAIAYARTFGFAQEVEMLRAMGLGKGGSLENAVVVDGDVVLNKEGLRSENEFVVHKTLDAVGDLYQLGMPIIGHFSGVKSGHMHTNQLLRQLMADKTAYAIVNLDDYEESLCQALKRSA
ncbi:MAG: UDP-3-O-acyl-N-acetylglucosamine deacetylase [Alphaproteobacteria bacterium]|nr:UDP-3-O-acyl-N-acetylglucosamine deacetylase [Alphaproteobacteria bacterium]MBQ8557587.1 UDP-3-O-acyl-N-acetylglucosamine deacetylase [Alphaproteobacteria bacterium]MBR4932783.1 UDP-3-O-acyl-N-acetylglucosamine deacetylase [Alphaproteobacteria bacterium]